MHERIYEVENIEKKCKLNKLREALENILELNIETPAMAKSMDQDELLPAETRRKAAHVCRMLKWPQTVRTVMVVWITWLK